MKPDAKRTKQPLCRKTVRISLGVGLIAALLGAGACGFALRKDRPMPEKTFCWQNPNPAVPMRDTDILPDGGLFYAVGTSPPYWNGPNPGVALYVSENLKDWKMEKMVIDREALPEDVWYRDRFWAPEIHRIRDKYYVTFNARNESEAHEHYHACAVAVADDVLGPYRVLTHDEPLVPWPSNDLTLFEDEDGKVYAFFNNGWTDLHKIFVAELDPETMKPVEEPVELIAQEPGTWDGGGIEGAQVVKHEGTYFLFYSSWTRGYAAGYATAKDVRGPYTKYAHNPLFGAWRREERNVRFREGEIVEEEGFPYTHAAHNQIFEGPDGRLWTACHAYTSDHDEAQLIFDPIWFENGAVRTDCPTWRPQSVPVDPDYLRRFPGLLK